MSEQKFWILCEEVETPDGLALVKLSKAEIGSEPITDLDQAVRFAMEYGLAEDIKVFVLEAKIYRVVGRDEILDDNYKPPKFTDVSESHFKRADS